MFKVLIYLFSTFGLDALQLGLILFFGWKLFTNHFKHLQDDITLIKEKVEGIEKSNNSHAERIATLEGKLSN